MGGVVALGLSALGFVYQNYTIWRMELIVLAACVFGSRYIIKLWAIHYYEQPNGDYYGVNQRIMFTGKCVTPSITLPVFQICGVLQWATFMILSLVI